MHMPKQSQQGQHPVALVRLLHPPPKNINQKNNCMIRFGGKGKLDLTQQHRRTPAQNPGEPCERIRLWLHPLLGKISRGTVVHAAPHSPCYYMPPCALKPCDHAASAPLRAPAEERPGCAARLAPAPLDARNPSLVRRLAGSAGQRLVRKA
ncbi:MAG: hypothetical protein OHK0022_54460 [Roseiflexaceae bacterium]